MVSLSKQAVIAEKTNQEVELVILNARRVHDPIRHMAWSLIDCKVIKAAYFFHHNLYLLDLYEKMFISQ